jgi:hypothetical protein
MAMIPVPSDEGPATVLPQPTPAPSSQDIFSAEFRQSNAVVAAFKAIKNAGAFEPVDGYSAWDEIKDKPQYLEHAYKFAGARSPAETEIMKGQIDQDEADRRTLAAAGPMGIVAGAVSGFLDPTMLLPGRVAIGVLKDGTPLVRGALEVGGAMAVQSTAQETALQLTQPGRALGESVVNVGSATILGALLGGAASWLSPAEHAAVVAGLDRSRMEGDAHVMGTPAPIDELKVRSEINRLFNDEIGRDELSPEAAALYDRMPEDVRRASEAIAGNTNKFDRFLTDEDVLEEEDLAPIRAARQKAAEEAAPRVQEWFSQNLPISGQGAGLATAAGAAATDTRKLDLVKTGVGLEKVPFDPVIQNLQLPFIAARRGTADLSEVALLVGENLKGESTVLGGGSPLETMLRIQQNQVGVKVRDELSDAWKDLRFGDKAPAAALIRDKLGAFGGLPDRGSAPTFEEFKTMVSDAMMNGDQHEISQVAAVAQKIRQMTFDAWGPRAEKAVEGFKRAEQKEGEGFFPHLWNKTLIQARRPEFVNKLVDKYTADQATKRASQGRLQALSERLKTTQKNIERLSRQTGKETEMADAVLEHDALRSRIEEEIGAWEGRSSSEAKSAIKAREKYAEKTERPEGESRLKSADGAVDAAVRRITEAGDKYERDVGELRARANETVDRILSSPDGRLPYDESAGTPDYGPSVPAPPVRGSLAERALNVSNDWARDWIERDIEQVTKNYLRTFVPDTLLAERFGDTEMSNVFRQINEEAAALIDATKAEKERTALGKQRDQAIENLAAIRDRFRGLYNIPTTGAARRLGRVSAAVRNANIPLSMGMGAVSSIPDAAGAVFRWGMAAAFKDAWAPFVKSLMTNRELGKEALRQFRVMGIAIDTATAQRSHSFSGLTEAYHPASPFERTLQWGADKFQLANLLGPWTDIAKTMASTVAATELYKAAQASAKGTATKKQLRALGEANITPDLAMKIAEQYEKHGNKVDNVLLPNTEEWTHRGARDAFEGALSREANISVITPGLDKPLFMSDPVFAVLAQFKSFTAAATTRLMIANLQRADAEVLQGLVASLGMGMMSYKINAITGGAPTSDRPQDWIKEAMSRGNIFGWLEEGNALASKMTRGGADIYRLIGADKPLSRFAGRTVLDQLIGPTFGKVESIAKVTGATVSGDWKADDVKALRRMIPMQNLAYLRGLFNQVEAGADNAFGIQQKQ